MLSLVLALLAGAAPATRPSRPPAQRPPWPPTTRLAVPPSLSATQPTTRPSPADYQRVIQLTRRSIQLIQSRKYDEAEAVIEQALGILPHHAVNLYNMACLKALRGRSDEAMDYLERSALEGFTDFAHIQSDPDLVSLRELPRFRQFLARKDELQRRAADRVLAWLKRELGGGYIFEIDETHKLVFATNIDARTLASLKQRLVAQAQSLCEQLFEHAPDQYISVVIPSPDDFRQIVPRPGVGGFYNHENRLIIAKGLGQTITHEFTHALHDADRARTGQAHPVWLTEGLATLFESARFVEQTFVPQDSYRLGHVQAAAKGNRLIPLARLLSMDHAAFLQNAMLAYAQAGSIMHYLYERQLLRRFYETYKATYDKDRTGKLALETVCARPLAQVEQEWKAWVLARKPPAANTAPDSAVLGVRFSTSSSGCRIDSVVPGGPAEKAGLRVGDIIVAFGGQEVTDQMSILQMLAAQKPGDRVVMTVRRDGEDVDVPVILIRRDRLGSATVPATRPAQPVRP